MSGLIAKHIVPPYVQVAVHMLPGPTVKDCGKPPGSMVTAGYLSAEHP